MRSMKWLAIAALAIAAGLGAGCGDNNGNADAPPGSDGGDDAPGPDARVTFDNLSETGLCLDPSCDQIAPDVHAYSPQFELYSDGATKRRWFQLPPGTQIDTADMDFWEFPIGTKIWKEFSRDGTRVETRLIQKIGPLSDDWFYAPYIWNAAQDSAVATPTGMEDANGTPHDVPSRAECKQCHDRVTGSVLGFSAIQLDHDAPDGEVALDELIGMDLLTTLPVGATPDFSVPGTATERATLGYMHTNCGHCHNPTSDVFRDITDIDLRLVVGPTLETAAATPIYTTSIGVTAVPPVNGATLRVDPGSLANSVLYQRFITANVSQHMPRIGTEITDPDGQLLIETWIGELAE
jgi:hypothetical protein